MDQSKEQPKIDGASHWVLEDHDKIQVAIFKIMYSEFVEGKLELKCIWVRKKIKLGYKRGKMYRVSITDLIQQKPAYPGGPGWRPVGDLEDLFMELKDNE